MHNSPCSAIFACQLAKYLVNKLEDMGLGESDTNDRPVLYTRLFKLLFGSVQNQGEFLRRGYECVSINVISNDFTLCFSNHLFLFSSNFLRIFRF